MFGSFFCKAKKVVRNSGITKLKNWILDVFNFFTGIYLIYFVIRFYSQGRDFYLEFDLIFCIFTIAFLILVIFRLIISERFDFISFRESIVVKSALVLIFCILIISFMNSCINMNKRWFIIGEVVKTIPENVRQIHPTVKPGTLLLFYNLPQHNDGLRCFNIGIHTAIQIVYNTVDRGFKRNIYHPKPNIYSFDGQKLGAYVKNPESSRYFWPFGLELNGDIIYFNVDFKKVEEIKRINNSTINDSVREIDRVLGFKGNKAIAFDSDGV